MDLDRDVFSCPICLDLLKEPVTTPCGHSYCMSCIQTHWDAEDDKGVHTCPECRHSFSPRPGLVKSTMLAALVEQLKKKKTSEDQAGDGDVACDFCCDRKLKAVKSCLQCLASYCDTHLQPHYQSATFGKHKLVEPSRKLQENVCPRHNEVMKMFCRLDQKIICYLCSMDEHKDHDTVTAAAERADRQRALEGSRLVVQQKIQQREKDVELLQQELETIARSADKTVEDSQKIFSEMIRLLEKRRSDVEQQVRSQQDAEVARVREHQEKLEQEIRELRSTDAELQKLSDIEDHNQFLKDYSSLPELSGSSDSSAAIVRPLKQFEDVTAAVSDLKRQLLDLLSGTRSDATQAVASVDVPLSNKTDVAQATAHVDPEPAAHLDIPLLDPEPKNLLSGTRSNVTQAAAVVDLEPKTRAGFLKYARDLSLSRNTANEDLLLSDKNRRVTYLDQPEDNPPHPDRFLFDKQVLSRQALTGRCYFEVSRKGRFFLAVAYRSISRDTYVPDCSFGHNNKSWALHCDKGMYEFWHNNVVTPVSGPGSNTLGVYLDHSAGLLSFYSVSRYETMTLLLRVQTRFTEPLHAGLGFYHNYGDMAEFCILDEDD